MSRSIPAGLPSPTFCIHPFEHLATQTNGHVLPCCVAADQGQMDLNTSSLLELWNGPAMAALRIQMNSGEIPRDCRRCFEEEKAGAQSYRLRSLEDALARGADFDSLLGAMNEEGQLSILPRSLDLRLGNVCNLQCVMCKPQESSKWATAMPVLLNNLLDNKELTAFHAARALAPHDRFFWYRQASFFKDLQAVLPGLRQIIIGGGEPFAIAEVAQLLDLCIAAGAASHISLRFHTNGTLLPEKVLAAFQHFERVEVMVSLDGVELQNTWVRFPASWQAITENLLRLDQTSGHVAVYVLASLHAVSIAGLPDLLRWRVQHPLLKDKLQRNFAPLLFLGLVHDPSFLDPRVLPAAFKRQIIARTLAALKQARPLYAGHSQGWEATERMINSALDFLQSEDRSAAFPQFAAYVRALDASRGTTLSSAYPELAAVIEQ